ncbi:Zinc-binding oxidoreductase CipB [Penicillium brevicompactum]|uniref:Zinc-binding oxidoreductase CipB n=1 Tax=Penicillium brevicompactum TaxID=5074 RepID=UPI002541FC58|nr:Zinc-binding oxidoreductase CipB [Penicillium brevicompactum]KAJ5336810.1 Zinc-binding oxidoreductase CipB [Penicillium brevicompactum]
MDPNEAAWLPAKCKPLSVREAPLVAPSSHEIVVKNAAVAINPVEWCKQLMGDLMFGFIKYPFILGNDCAGTVAKVGDGVTRFKVGDRVLAHAIGMDPDVNKSSEGAFQKFTVIRENMASQIPIWMSFEEACVLPLGLSTAACALFQKDFLALQKPDVANLNTLTATEHSREVVLVWGGSSSVGSNAIQLAKAAGYEVIATASPSNFEYVHGLGATECFNYKNENVVKEIIEAIGQKKVAGAIAIGNGSTEACMDILSRTKGNKFVAQISFKFPSKIPPTDFEFVRAVAGLVWSNFAIFLKSKLSGVKTKMVFGSTLAHNEVGNLIYEDFLPTALEKKQYQAAPKAIVVGKGLGTIQEAMYRHMNAGASAAKYVVYI